jgi:nitrogen-specific signal transduction histidine kinase
MAYVITAAIATANATPKIGQRTRLALTIDNSGSTVAVHLNSIQCFVREAGIGKPYATEHPILGAMPTGAGSGAGLGVAIAAGATASVYYWEVVCKVAGAVSFDATCTGTRDDTGAAIVIPTAAGVTLTAS